MAHQMSESEMRQCASECSRCHDVCTETAQHCLEMGGKHAEKNHLRLMLDCAQICNTSRDFLLRMSDQHMHTCRACAEICEACADDCERVGGDMMKPCIDACRRCAESCRHMTGAAA